MAITQSTVLRHRVHKKQLGDFRVHLPVFLLECLGTVEQEDIRHPKRWGFVPDPARRHLYFPHRADRLCAPSSLSVQWVRGEVCRLALPFLLVPRLTILKTAPLPMPPSDSQLSKVEILQLFSWSLLGNS